MTAPNTTSYILLSDVSLQQQAWPQNKAYPSLQMPDDGIVRWRNVRPGVDTRPAFIHILAVPLKKLVAATYSSRRDTLKHNYESDEIKLNFEIEAQFPKLTLKPQVSQVVLSADPPPSIIPFNGFSVTMVRDNPERVMIGDEWLLIYRRWNGALRAIVREQFLSKDQNEELV